MVRLKAWLNRKIAQILGDVQEPKPLEDPSPARAGCRIFFVVSLVVMFSLLLGYIFTDAPDALVVQMHHLTPGDKNHAFPSCFLYDRSSPKCTKWSTAKFPVDIPVSCPCTNTSARWIDFVKFYILHTKSTDWNMGFNETTGLITLPPDTAVRLRDDNIVKGNETLNAEKFCNLSYRWPFAVNSSTSPGKVAYEAQNVAHYGTFCRGLASLLFKPLPDRTQFLNNPSLLKREELNTLLPQLAREAILLKRLDVDTSLSLDVDMSSFLDAGNEKNHDLRRFYDSLAHTLTGLLDRDEMNSTQSYIDGAMALLGTSERNLLSPFYDSKFTVWFLKDDLGLIFLQREIDWEAYRQHCNPKYCEVTMSMQVAQRLYWALGILGGVATIVLAFVTTLLWPCTAMLLLWISNRMTAAMATVLALWIPNRKADAAKAAGTPQSALLQDPSLERTPA